MGRDYRLNYRLDEACDRDAKEICGKDVCDRTQEISCGGKVLHCLVEKKDEIKAESCKQEVYYYIKMEVCITPLCTTCIQSAALLRTLKMF